MNERLKLQILGTWIPDEDATRTSDHSGTRDGLPRSGRVWALDPWVHVPFGNGWVAHLRFKGQEDRPVIAEMRISPASDTVPVGGLQSADLRDIPGPNELVSRLPVDQVAAAAQTFTGREGDFTRAPWGFMSSNRASRQRKYSPLFYALVAKHYVDAWQTNHSRVAQDTAERVNGDVRLVKELGTVNSKRVVHLIEQAERQGHIAFEPGPKRRGPGRSPRLTEIARETLDAAEPDVQARAPESERWRSGVELEFE